MTSSERAWNVPLFANDTCATASAKAALKEHVIPKVYKSGDFKVQHVRLYDANQGPPFDECWAYESATLVLVVVAIAAYCLGYKRGYRRGVNA